MALEFNTLDELKRWQASGVVAGFIPDLDIDLYHHPECPGFSKTSLDKIHLSPAHLAEYKRQPPEPRDWGNVGNAVHTAILQPNLFETHYVKLPEGVNFAMKEGKDLKAQAETKGQTILRHTDYVDVLGMAKAARSHPYAKSFLFDGEAVVEGSAFWVDEETGVLCKTRPDRLRDDGIVTEIKTTTDASQWSFSRTMEDYRYHVQGAFQIDGVRAVMGKDPKFFCIVVIEKSAPYAINVFAVERRAVDLGRLEYRQNLRQIQACQASGVWTHESPMYPNQILTLDLPERSYA